MISFKEYAKQVICVESITPEIDKLYLQLAEDPIKNRDRLQKMVDQAALANGYVEVFRAVRSQNADYLEPRPGYQVSFSTRKHVADSYGEKPSDTKRFFINDSKAKEFPVGNYFSKVGFDQAANRQGGLIVARGVYDSGPYASTERDPEMLYSYSSDIYAISKHARDVVRSADAVVKGDSGNVIPLSRRFQ